MNDESPTSSKPSGRWIAIGLVIIAMAIAAVLSKDALRPPPPAPPPPPPPEMPAAPPKAARVAAPVQTRSGAMRDLTQPPGKLLILHFWATWCPPCVEELPSLLAYWRELKKDGKVELLAVSVDDNWKVVDAWLKQRAAMDLPVALDPKRETASRFGTQKFPETYIISAKGETLSYVKGPFDWSSKQVRKRIEELKNRAD